MGVRKKLKENSEPRQDSFLMPHKKGQISRGFWSFGFMTPKAVFLPFYGCCAFIFRPCAQHLPQWPPNWSRTLQNYGGKDRQGNDWGVDRDQQYVCNHHPGCASGALRVQCFSLPVASQFTKRWWCLAAKYKDVQIRKGWLSRSMRSVEVFEVT